MSTLVPPSEQRRRARQAAERIQSDDSLDHPHNEYNDGFDFDYEKIPAPNTDKVLTTASEVESLYAYIRYVKLQAFLDRMRAQPDYLCPANFARLISGAKIDARGRFMKKNSKGEEEEVRFMYAARGREQLAFNNGKTGNAYPPQWASSRTLPTSITIEPIRGTANMARKRAYEDEQEHLCILFTTSQAARQWAMGVALPCATADSAKDMRGGLSQASTTFKTHYRGELEKAGAQWLEPTLGGEFFPKAERPLFIKGGEERDPGVTSDRTFDHDLLKGLKGNDFVYNSVPSVVVLDVEDMDEWEVSWHQAHLLPNDALWEVGCFLRAYVGKKVRVGFQLILESLVLHGQEERVVLSSPAPKKRTADHFSAYRHGNDGEGSSTRRQRAEEGDARSVGDEEEEGDIGGPGRGADEGGDGEEEDEEDEQEGDGSRPKRARTSRQSQS
ncbi:hypothetical protein OC834_004898 [Tilletia horrida]|nr:hypothetical protein OC834_004898 [Tilletia horrida]